MQNELNTLSQDLLALYCKTRSAKIENLFIKIAQVQSLTDLTKKLRASISPDVYRTIQVLETIRNAPNLYILKDKVDPNRIDQIASHTAIVIECTRGSTAMSPETFYSTLKIIKKHSAYSSLFAQYKTIVEQILSLDTAKKAPEPVNVTTINESMDALATSQFDNLKPDSPEMKKNKYDMFAALLDKFNKDLISAYQNSNIPNKDAIIAAINSGALYQPNKFGKLIPMVYDGNITGLAQQAINTVFNINRLGTENIESNYEFIKNNALRNMGAKPIANIPKPAGNEKEVWNEYDRAVKEKNQGAIDRYMNNPESKKIIMKYMTPEQRREQEAKDIQSGKAPDFTEQSTSQTTIAQNEWTLPTVMAVVTAIFNLMYKQLYNK